MTTMAVVVVVAGGMVGDGRYIAIVAGGGEEDDIDAAMDGTARPHRATAITTEESPVGRGGGGDAESH